MKTLDLETKSVSGDYSDHMALEPWRVRQGKAFILSISVYHENNQCTHVENPTPAQLIEILDDLAGCEVFAHNSVFDVAWLIASIQPNKFGSIPECVRKIRWRDSMLLAKWVLNGQKFERLHYSLSLANLVGDALRDDPDVQQFIDFKKQGEISEDSEYWNLRGQLDVLWTHKLVNRLFPRLAPTQYVGWIIESKCIVPVANSWLIGLKIDKQRLLRLHDELAEEDRLIHVKTGFDISMATSPKRLGNLLFSQMGLASVKNTPTGNPSTDEESLKKIEYSLKQAGDERAKLVDQIMDVRYNATIRSKYVKTTLTALERTGDGYVYPIPKLFGTSSGRFTYSNETVKGVKVSLAAHQMPRKEKRVREAVICEEGMGISEWDAAGQESRIMCLHSRDPVMTDIFLNHKNFHSMTACNIIGVPYNTFQAKVDAEDPEAIEYRQMGKLTNLSCNFRISGPALSAQAFTKYDMLIPIPVGNKLVSTFKHTYTGVPRYWDRAIQNARQTGYTNSASDRRYQIDTWDRAWMSEQSALSLPIQATGADHKLIAIATVHEKNPDALFLMDLHDALFYIVPRKEEHDNIGATLNSIDYKGLWSQLDVNIPLPFEGKYGTSFRDVK